MKNISVKKNSPGFMFWQPLTVLQRIFGHKHCCWQPYPYFGNLHCSSQYFPVKPAGQTAAKICQYTLTNKFIFELILRIHFKKILYKNYFFSNNILVIYFYK